MSLQVDVDLRVGTFDLCVRNLELSHGITALFGPSGAGKTLTLRCVAGLSRPHRGRIVLDGRVLFDRDARLDVPPRERKVGYLFQQYALFPHLTVENNIAYGIRALDKAQRTERVKALLDLVGMKGFETRRPSELSGGQQQRVALARALATEPRLLLLDEPFAAVDMRVRKRLRTELRRIHEVTGTPMLLVTHDLAEVRQLSDTLVLIEDGRVVCSGTTQELLTHPVDSRLSELLEESV